MSIISHGKIVSVLQYFTNKIEDYWHILYPIIPEFQRERDKYLYFYDISKKATGYKGEFTKNGIYMFWGYDGKYHVHALEIAQYSLACWIAWRKTKNKKWLDKALIHCEWLITNQEKNGGWYMEHKNPSYDDLPSPWPSALAQGLAISSLIRAFYYTKDLKYLSAAKLSCDFLEKRVEEGGVKRSFYLQNMEAFIYEEYPRKQISGVLNGYISAVLGIYELSKICNTYEKLFRENINNLLRILPLYDLGYWSYYSLDNNLSSGYYHRLVVMQLNVLKNIDYRFNKYYLKFLAYQNNKLCAIKAFLAKIKEVLSGSS